MATKPGCACSRSSIVRVYGQRKAPPPTTCPSKCQDSMLSGQLLAMTQTISDGMTDDTGTAGLQNLFRSHYDEVLAYCARRMVVTTLKTPLPTSL